MEREIIKSDSNRPAFIRVAPDARVDGLTMINNTVTGNADFLDNQGKLSNATFEDNEHIVPSELATTNDPRWYQKPLGILFIMIVGSVLAAGVVFFLEWN